MNLLGELNSVFLYIKITHQLLLGELLGELLCAIGGAIAPPSSPLEPPVHTTLTLKLGMGSCLAYMKNLPSCRENLSITIQKMSANELSCMNSHKQIVIEDSGIFIWQVCSLFILIRKLRLNRKKLN